MKVISVTSTAAGYLPGGRCCLFYGQHEGGDKQEQKQPQQHAQQPQQRSQPQRVLNSRAPEQAAPHNRLHNSALRSPNRPRPQAQQAQAAPSPSSPGRQRISIPGLSSRSKRTRTGSRCSMRQTAAPQQQQRAQAQQQLPRQQSQPHAGEAGALMAATEGMGSRAGHRGTRRLRRIGRRTGPPTIARGRNAAATAGITSRRPNSVCRLAPALFRLGVIPVMYMGYPQFAYGGFSFLMVDPWPSDWSANWYSADDVYVDYDDGYYLYNRSYPQERLAITIGL